MASFDTLIRQQEHLHHRISNTIVNFKKLGKDNITQQSVEARTQLLSDYWRQFVSGHDALLADTVERNEDDPYFTDDVYVACENAYILARSELLQMRAAFPDDPEPRHNRDGSHSTDGTSRSYSISRSLPKITLPKFSGEYQSWPSFRDLFKSMIDDNSDISAVEKMHYLKSNITGEAARLLANVPVTADEYPRAWDALVTRYENKRALVTAYFDQLFSSAALSRKSASDLKELVSTVKESIGGLKALGAPVDAWELFLVYSVARRLDADSREAWELLQGTKSEPATFRELETFLEGRIRALEVIAPCTGGKPPRTTKAPQGRSHARAHVAAANSSKCSCCSGAHYIASCPDFSAKPLGDRREILISRRLCFNCLGPHQISECRSSKRCRVCNGHHHTLIHRASADASANPPTVTPAKDSAAVVAPAAAASTSRLNPTANSFHLAMDSSEPRSLTLLTTARVRILRDRGDAVEARALLDQGSELSFVRESLAQTLRLPRRHASVPILGIGSQPSCTTRGVLSLRLQSCSDPNFVIDVAAYILPRLTGRVPSQDLSPSSWSHLGDLVFADPEFGTPGPIDLVLGADVYGHLLRGPLRQGGRSQLVAQDTEFGWIVSGLALEQSTSTADKSVPYRSLCGSKDLELEQLLSQFWRQEEVAPITTPKLSEDEERCEAHFRETHSRSPSGRYTVRLPFRVPAASLGRSRSLAERTLRRMHQRFATSPDLSRLYSDFLQEYEDLGHMRRVPPAQPHAPVFFLLHHGVLRPGNTTSKLRVVFNGSARSTSGLSLNECLHTGPKLQQDLADVLLRWRRYPFVFLADVEKMYRQIDVHPADRDFQRILWSQAGEPDEYQLSTVTYGLSCAPFLALRVLLQLADDSGAQFPEAASILRQEMYVDDVLSGADTLTLAKTKTAQVNGLLIAGGFRLHKWMANHDDILSEVIGQPAQLSCVRGLAPDALPRALGLAWDPLSDSLVFQFQSPPALDSLTKRIVLSRVAQLFDPLGWITPILLVAKLFVQGLWKLQVDWDQPLQPYWAQRWRDFETELGAISSLSLPRWLGVQPASVLEFHGFSDASNDALGAVLYLRSISGDGVARVSLVVAKSKVAPIKRVTIPRLELSAAVLLTRLLARARRVLQLEQLPVHLWTDSSVVLAWLQGHPSRWRDFVANRVSAIKESAPEARWHHISGVDNPADCASRGLSPRLFLDHQLWWNGPSFLHTCAASWDSSIPPIKPGVNLEERAASSHLAKPSPGNLWELVFRYSKLSRLFRITAWLSLASSRFRGTTPPRQPLALNPQDIANAELFWVRQVQRAQFPQELAALSRGESLPRSYPFSRLTPFLDADGVLRIGGRLRNARLDPDAKHPILLPRDAFLSHLIIEDIHLRTMHGGVQLVLGTLRQKFWILGGRAPVSSFIRRCVRCVRYRADAAKQLMGQLPPSRVVPARPFFNSGVDYAGPFTLKTWRGRANRSYKGFLVIFVCMATSAVHLELATDYSTAGFLAAFKRFCARRGICATLTSDCGTNLVGADAELRKLFASTSKELGELANQLSSDGICWRFNPPGAPHFGGKWEAAVKSTKFHLRRVVGDAILTYEEFSTVLTQIEAVLNSRPICPLSDDPADIGALTPAHFLIGDSLSVVPEPSLSDIQTSRLSRWQHLSQMTERFWQRWSTEYLQRLQGVAKWQHPSRQIALGTLVLIRDERYPPAKWPLGRVIETHAGADGLVRVATVRTASSVLKRPIVKLCPLPISA